MSDPHRVRIEIATLAVPRRIVLRERIDEPIALRQPGLRQPGLEQPGLEQPGLEQPDWLLR